MDPKTILAIAITTFVTSLIALLVSRIFRKSDKREKENDEETAARKKAAEEEAAAEKARDERRDQRMTELETQMRVLMAEAKPINAMMLALATSKMTHFHTPRMDELLAKVGPPATLTDEEEEELEQLRQERIVEVAPVIDREERIFADIFPQLRELAEIEQNRIATGTQGTMTMHRVLLPQSSDEQQTEQSK